MLLEADLGGFYELYKTSNDKYFKRARRNIDFVLFGFYFRHGCFSGGNDLIC